MPAVAEIAEQEGLRLRAYPCPAGVLTIARGKTSGVVPGMTCTVEQADQWFCDDLTTFTAGVQALCTGFTDTNQLGAMVSLTYNIGLGAFKTSTVLRCHNLGDANGASRAFGLFNKARVKGQLIELDGLTARRAAEAALYLKPDPDAEPAPPMPQAVQGESNLAASPINLTAAIPVVGGTVTLLSTFSEQAKELIGKLNELAALLGIQPTMVLGGVALITGCIVIWNRVAQRRNGWA